MMSVLPLNFILSSPLNLQILYFGLSLVIAVAGWDRKMGFWGYLFCSILLSPVIGFMMFLVSGKREQEQGGVTDKS